MKTNKKNKEVQIAYKEGIKTLLNEETGDQRYIYEQHGKAVTRRDMLKAGIIQFSAAAVLPSAVEWLAKSGLAEAQEVCNVAAGSSKPAYVHFNGAGGFAIGSQYIPGSYEDPNTLLSSYSTRGMGSTANLVAQGLIIDGGFKNPTKWYANSAFLTALQTAATPATLKNTVFVHIPVQTGDDSSNNKFDASGMIIKAGLLGNSLPNIGTQQSMSGGRHLPAYVPPPAPLVVNAYSDLARAIQVAGALGQLSLNQKTSVFRLINRLTTTQKAALGGAAGADQLAHLTACATQANVALVGTGNPDTDLRTGRRKDGTQVGAQLSTTWGNVNAGTADGSQNLVFGSMVYNALKGNSATVNCTIGGCDYHGNGRTAQDGTDGQIGLQVGRTLQSASIMMEKVFVKVSTDGAVSSPASDQSGGGFTSDSGGRGGCMLFAYDPTNSVTANGSQVGGLTPGQVASTAFPTGGSAEIAAVAVLANYASFAGLPVGATLDAAAGAGARSFNTAQLTAAVKIFK